VPAASISLVQELKLHIGEAAAQSKSAPYSEVHRELFASIAQVCAHPEALIMLRHAGVAQKAWQLPTIELPSAPNESTTTLPPQPCAKTVVSAATEREPNRRAGAMKKRMKTSTAPVGP